MITRNILMPILLFCITIQFSFGQEKNEKPSGINLLEKSLNTYGIDSAQNTFAYIKNNNDKFDISERDFINLGYSLLADNKVYEASKILEMGLELNPESINILLFLASAYYQNNEPEKGINTINKRFDAFAKRIKDDYINKNAIKIDSNADEIISKFLDATGGKEKWNSVKTIKITFTVQPNEGDQQEIVRMYKQPNLFRQGNKSSNRFTSTDGINSWNYNGEEWKETSTTFRFASMHNYAMNYKEMGITYEYVGIDVLNYSPVYHLKRTFPDGFKENLYFSTESYLLQEIKSDYSGQFPFMQSYFSLWDYREVNGIKVPHVFIRNVGELGPPHGGVITDVQINVPLDDSLFIPKINNNLLTY